MSTPAFTASATRLVGALPVLFAGCVGSQVPLTAPEDGFVDTTIVGTWREEGGGALEGFDEELISVSIDDGRMAIVANLFGTCSTAEVYTAHSSLLGGQKYLNLRFVRCVGDAENGQRIEECPYYIVRYATQPDFSTLRNDFGAEAYAELVALQESAAEPLALLNLGDPDYVGSAIETRVVEGCTTCARHNVPCLAARPRALRRFVTRHADEIFPLDGWGLWRRVDAVAAAPSGG